MKLAVSSIAWANEEEPEIASKLQELGVRYLEIAPTKIWKDPTAITKHEADTYKDWWRNFGIEIVALQSMLFNRPDLKIFESPEGRQETQDYLEKFIQAAEKFNAKAMVFGSPKNRHKGDLSSQTAEKEAIQFFGYLGEIAYENNLSFCLEPNAPQYNCDFITNAKQGLDLVKKVDKDGFRLHLDLACMALAGDNVREAILSSRDYLRHFHISAPMLGEVDSNDNMPHHEAASALDEIGYSGFVSIEMRPGETGTNVERVERAVRYVKSNYVLN